MNNPDYYRMQFKLIVVDEIGGENRMQLATLAIHLYIKRKLMIKI